MPDHLRNLWPARPTVVLAVAVALGLVLALVVVDDSDPVRPPTAAPSTLAPSPTASSPPPVPTPESPPGVVAAALNEVEEIEEPGRTWVRLADCESGEWDAEGTPIRGSADWAYGTSAQVRFEGGLHFEPSTWDEFRDPGMAEHAGEAELVNQVVVAERVLDAQGWGAWPVCSRKLGLR